MKDYFKPGIILCLIVLILGACQQRSAFIKVQGMHFMRNGKPYRFAGFNMWYAAYLGATQKGRERLTRELDTLKSIGCTNLRILGASEISSFPDALPKAFEHSPGNYDDSLLTGLDYALTEMGQRGIYAVIYLNNFWQWTGGMAQYVLWSRGDSVAGQDSTGSGSAMERYSAKFYSDSSAIRMNRKYISMLVNRVNIFTGIPYKNDPAIMAWELANEPRPGPDDSTGIANIPAFMKWIHGTAEYIHSIDPNHLVTTGSEGIIGTLQSEKYFLEEHDSPYIDYMNFHLWAKNWGWFDPHHIDETLPVSEKNAKKYILQHIRLARELKKPITMEEFGMDRDNGATEPRTPVTARNQYFKFVYSIVTESITGGSPLSGSNIWAWGGYGMPVPVDLVINDPGAYLGDPLGEAQGLNSVYVSDTSTLSIFKENALKLKK